MTKQARAGLMSIVALTALGLASCDHYNCPSGLNFGSSTCSNSSITGPGGGSTGGSATAAFVFAVDQGTGSGGTIDGFTLDTTANTFQATPSFTAPTIPVNNGGVGMVVAQKQFLYAGFGTVGQIFGWTISPTGSLTAIAGSPFTASLDFLGTVGEAAMITNPAGTMLFVSDQLESKIFVFQIGTGGVLTPATPPSITLPLGFEPMNLATDGLGKYLYASNGNSSTHTATGVAAFVIGSSGTLTPVPGSPFSGSNPNYQMWLVRGEPTGNFLIGTTGETVFDSGIDDLHLYVFSIAQSGATAGAITPVSGSPFPTVFSPFSIAVQSNTSGNLLYSFSINDTATGFNAAEGYTISSAGVLTADTGSPFSGLTNGSWGQFDQSGAFLFDYGSFLDINTNTVVTQLSPFDVGTGGALTQPITTLTLTTPGFWAVTDAP
jgi:hypothetical protein